KASRGVTFASVTDVTGTGSITGVAGTFKLTGTTGGAWNASTIAYVGFSAADATQVSGASGFADDTKVTRSMTFTSATDVTGTGSITGVAGTFNLTGTTAGASNAPTIDYVGFSAADATTVTGASGFADNTKASRGVTFASVTDVTG